MKKVGLLLLALLLSVATFARGQKDAPVILESDGPQYVSPNNDGIKDTAVLGFTVKMKLRSLAGYIPKYGIQVVDKDGKSVNEIEGKEKRDISGIESIGREYEYFEIRREIMWDLRGLDGNIVPDGEYTVRVWVQDASRNRSEMDIEKFIVDTVAPKVELAFENDADTVWFSPKGERKTVKILVNGDKEAMWVLQIVDKEDEPVVTKRLNDEALTEFVWDGCDDNGNLVADGAYAFKVMGEDYAGNKSEPEILAGITVDNRPTDVKLSADYEGFSPNGDGKRDTLEVKMNYALDTDFVSWSWRIEKTEAPAEESETAAAVKNGPQPTMKSGDVVKIEETVVVIEETEEPETAAVIEETEAVAGIEATESELMQTVASENLPETITLDGKDENGNALADDYYRFIFSVEYKNGNKEEASLPFLIDTQAPVVDLKSVANPFIKVKEDIAKGEYFITLDVKDEMKLEDWDMEIIDNKDSVLKMFAGEGDPSRMITWNGEVSDVTDESEIYYIDFKITDKGGNETVVRRPVILDILLIERDGKYYLMVPNIIFGAYQFKLDSYSPEYYERNLASIDRILDVYKRYPTYNLVLEGHALNIYDPITNAEENKEEEKILEPLTVNRAEEVKDALVEKGFNTDKVIVQTFGGKNPIFDTQDENENWKNRRVEFVMELKPFEELIRIAEEQEALSKTEEAEAIADNSETDNAESEVDEAADDAKTEVDEAVADNEKTETDEVAVENEKSEADETAVDSEESETEEAGENGEVTETDSVNEEETAVAAETVEAEADTEITEEPADDGELF